MTIAKISLHCILNTSYRKPAGRYIKFEIYVKQLLPKSENQKFYLVRDLNRSLLDHNTNAKETSLFFNRY